MRRIVLTIVVGLILAAPSFAGPPIRYFPQVSGYRPYNPAWVGNYTSFTPGYQAYYSTPFGTSAQFVSPGFYTQQGTPWGVRGYGVTPSISGYAVTPFGVSSYSMPGGPSGFYYGR